MDEDDDRLTLVDRFSADPETSWPWWLSRTLLKRGFFLVTCCSTFSTFSTSFCAPFNSRLFFF